MSSWQDRIQPEITLIAPNGDIFRAVWKGDPRHMEKKLGIFTYPKIPGAVIQDLSVGPIRYPLTFFFDGPNHDRDAQDFFEACGQVGAWSVDHPTKGFIELQLMSVTEEIQPVDAAGMTAFTTEWVSASDIGDMSATTPTPDSVNDQNETVQVQSVQQFVATVDVNKLEALRTAATVALSNIRKSVKDAKQTVSRVRSQIDTVYRAAVNTTQSTVLDVVALAGELRILVQLPGQMIDDTAARFDFYTGLIEKSLGLTPDKPSTGNINRVAVQELVTIACVSGIVQTVVDADLSNREDALSYIDAMGNVLNTVTNMLDASQTLYSDNRIDRRYFSQSEIYNDLVLLVAMATNLLIKRSYDLAVAKRFTLERNRTPVEIAITEGVDLDLFISSNHLKGDDILLLPAGRQVVVYP